MGAEHEPDANREGSEEAAQVDGAADAPPGTVPEGATPSVEATPGDPLADAHDDVDGPE
jgi:hypothetical protein